MPQLDKLLNHLAAKKGLALRLAPNQQPKLELPGGTSVALLPNPLPGTLLDLLANEVLPKDCEASWTTAGETNFEYGIGDGNFHIQMRRTSQGICIDATPSLNPVPAKSVITLLRENDPEFDRVVAPSPTIPIVLDFERETPAPHASVAPRTVPASVPLEPSPVFSSPIQNVPPLADKLFKALLAHKGSDLHLSSFETPSMRVDGDLQEIDGFNLLGPNELLELMRALATEVAWRRFQEHHDSDFAYAYEAGACRFRMNYFMDRQGPGLVCRVIPEQIPDPDKLGLPDPIRRLADLSKGLVLVTGPTGSGKSTTLAAILDLANQRRHDHILTIEDPIEFIHPRKRCLVNQREVGTHTESFKSGLRAALREDPDIVLVGEMRDLETIAIALETAITGHLVFGTLHTNSAIGTIDRIVDQFPADRQQQIRVMLADCLKASLSQMLLKKTTGGRVAAIESLFVTPAIANLMREGKNYQIPSAMQTGRAYGQKLMNDALIELIQSRQVEVMEAYMKCPDKDSFVQACKRYNIPCDPRGLEGPAVPPSMSV